MKTNESTKETARKAFENAARERDAARMARKMGSDSHAAREVYQNLRSGK
jgi:hypothetical protein